MYHMSRIETRCDFSGPPICSVISVGIETMDRNYLEVMKRQAFFPFECAFPRSGHLGHPLVSIYFGSKVGYRSNCKVGRCASVTKPFSPMPFALYMFIQPCKESCFLSLFEPDSCHPDP